MAILKRLFSDELKETLDIRYGGKYIKKRNPKFKYRKVTPLTDGVNQTGLLIENGKRKLYVRTFDGGEDKMIKKTAIHKDYKGNFILNVKNSDTKDYTKVTGIIDKALKLK